MEFSLVHQMLLLSLNNKGKFSGNSVFSLNFGLAGGLLSELTVRNYIEIRNNKVKVLKPDAKNSVFDLTLKIIAAKKKNKSVQYWISSLSYKIRKIKHQAMNDLVDAGVIRKEQHRFLGIFTYYRYPILKPEVQKFMVDEIRQVLLNDKPAGVMTVLLISLLNSCNAFYDLFPDKAERKKVTQAAATLFEKRLNAEMPEIAEIKKAVDVSDDGLSAPLTSLN